MDSAGMNTRPIARDERDTIVNIGEALARISLDLTLAACGEFAGSAMSRVLHAKQLHAEMATHLDLLEDQLRRSKAP